MRLGTAEALPFPARTFDLVTLVRVLAHLQGPTAALREARRVLRPGGRVVLAAHGADHLRVLGGTLHAEAPLEAALAALRWEAERREVRVPMTLTAADLAALAASYGLRPATPDDTLQDTLHLTVLIARP